MAFSIKQLLLCMAYVAIGLMALANADKPFIKELVDLLTLGTLVFMAYAAWTRQAEPRAFRIGFLCWGALYYWMFKRRFDIGTLHLIDLASRMVQPDGVQQGGFGGGGGGVFGGGGFGGNWVANFHSISHSVLLLLFGLIGGWVTVYFYRKRQRMLGGHEVDQSR